MPARLRATGLREVRYNSPVFNKYRLDQFFALMPGGAAQIGEIFYVDPGEGDDNNTGETPDKAKKTSQAGIDLCVANRGDVVIRMRGGENVTATVTFDCAGMTFIAEGYGMAPLAIGEYFAIYSDSLTADPVAIVSADGVTIAGIGFAGDDAGSLYFSGAALLIGGEGEASPFGVRIVDCRFPKWGLDNRIGLAIDGSSDCLVEHCSFEGGGADFDSGIYLQGPMQNIEIRDCRFRDCTYGILCGTFTGSPDGPHAIIKSNIFEDSKVFSAGDGLGALVDNWSEGATDSGSYNDSVTNLKSAGWTFSDNHYLE